MLTDRDRVHRTSKDKLRRTVVSRANVGNVGFVRNQNLGGAEITKLEDTRARVQQKVLRLDVAMANTEGVDVGEGTEKLVHVELRFAGMLAM